MRGCLSWCGARLEPLQPKTVDVHIAGLRRKLGGALQITALRGVGYRLEP